MHIIKKFLILPLTAILMTLSLGATAQQHFAWTTMTVNPVTAGGLENSMKMLRGAMDETNTPFYWLVAQSQSGEEHFAVMSPYQSFSVMDVNWGAAIPEALNEAELEEFVTGLRTSVKSMVTDRFVGRPDLGRTNPQPFQGVPDAVITMTIDVLSGKERQFEDYVHQVIAATETSDPDTYWDMWAPTFGANNYKVVVIIPQWEDLDSPAKSVPQRILEHFGERRGERMIDEAAGYVNDVKTTLYRTRPDLGRPPPAQ